MGRSKFPGKPSKSINRKRISVLQIEQHEDSSAAAAAAATAKQQGGDEEDTLAAPATASSATAAKNNNKNGRNNDDDDDDDDDGKNGSSGGGVGTGGGVGGPTKAATNGGGNSNSNGNNKKVNGSSEGHKNGSGGNDKDNASVEGQSNQPEDGAKDEQKNATNEHSDKNVVPVESNDNDINEEEKEEEEEDEEDEEDEDSSDKDEDSEEIEHGDNKTSNGLNCKKLKKRIKKFQNLNILKPEVMLPSSSKQNRDLGCLSPTIAMNNPFANHIDANFKPGSEKLHKKPDAQISSESKPDKSENTTSSKPAATTSTNSSTHPSSSDAATISESNSASKPKKSVTFKNILETSDDKCAVKKFYNPNNRIPLVSIMKKECMNRTQNLRSGECIVRPSRLDEILKNKNNIDKLDSLKFRPSLLSTAALSSTSKSDPFAISPLSRAFGALDEEEATKETNGVRFHETAEEKRNIAEATDNETNAKTDEVDDEGDDCDDEQQMIVDKHFILPKRSTRSSRVIKPNKRLLEDGIICRKSALSNKIKSNANNAACTTEMQANNLLAPKKEGLATTTTTTISDGANSTLLQKNYFGLGKYYESNIGVDGLKLLPSSKDSKNFGEMKPNLSVLTTALKLTAASSTITTNTSTSCNSTFGIFGSLKANSSFVLRQPRLQFESLNERISSSNTRGNTTTPATLTSQKPIFAAPTLSGATTAASSNSLLGSSNCTICDSNIPSKNVQQLCKYGGLACAICRKFISKITKKSIAASASPTLKPLQLYCKNDGVCCIQPSAKSKNFKKIYKERCAACWLKKCMQNLQFSTGHKQRLSAVITTLKPSNNNSNDSKRSLHLSAAKDSTAAVTDNERSVSLTSLKKEPGLLSPTGASAVTTNRLASVSNTSVQKWKTTDSLTLNLKSNPLAENNVTFGSAPLLRPAILEKPLFLTSGNAGPSNVSGINEKQSTKEKLSATNCETQIDSPAEKHTSKSKRKHKEKSKDKEKEKSTDQEKDSARPIATENAAIPISVVATSKGDEILPATSCIEDITNNSGVAINVNETLAVADVSTDASAINPLNTVAASPTIANSSPISASGEPTKRQRIDLKGPRVKHVCRSASIVLGQPLATFGDGEDEEMGEVEHQETDNNLLTATSSNSNPTMSVASTETNALKTDENDNCSTCTKPEQLAAETQNLESTKSNSITSTVQATLTTNSKQTRTQEPASFDRPLKEAAANTKLAAKTSAPTIVQSKNLKSYNINTTIAATTTAQIGKKYMRHLSYNNNIENTQQQIKRKDGGNVPPTKTLISIDFWENYDPAEVCQTGFGLIVTEPVAQRALCFLCGSAGLDPLIFCACCCEPYHQYCVLDEYNLKHSSLDDTMASLLLDSSGLAAGASNSDGAQLLTQRLNWLCPRCTVCYTCNMSSGSKVKCQKCQKNYHSTCLGTSKRLLGADRPLICVNCLKCKSCGTTKVSKFVGNLPLCMPCFKLRKRGNFCPICQKCYDDNDSDPKTMECGDCKQWVHSKCEGLSDEQYNLLSTLPETIEFICKKCARRNEHSKQRAEEWRQVVMEEFKSSLMSVLKLLSKSHQACALLKLSPRKKVNCTCGAAALSSIGNGRIQPKALLFSTSERDPLGSDGESQCSEDIYEFNESQPTVPFNVGPTKVKANAKCTCGAFNASQSAANSNGTTTAYNSYFNSSGGSTQQSQLLSLVEIKKKIANNLYTSLAEFNYDMNNVIQHANSDELIIAYKEILSEQFPWFQNETKACTDALEEDMFESCASYGMNSGGGSSDICDDGYGISDAVAADLDRNERDVDLPPDVEDIVFTHKSRHDARICLFCRKTGEGVGNEESRLLYCGQDCWVHTNCAMWSAEVFEEIDGSLQNVHSAVARGRMIKCTVCGNRGATVGCNIKSCGEHYHYPCARSICCAFLTDKSVYCPSHARDALVRNSSPNVAVETNFEVTRPVYVELDRRRKKLIEPQRVQFHIGSLEVRQLGVVLPRFSDTFEAIVPVNFLCSRLYWSCKQPWKIVEYTVRTVIQNSCSSLTALDMGRNFTVDHSNANSSLVQLGLAQIARWHSSLSRNDLIEIDNGPSGLELTSVNRGAATFSKLLPEYLPHLQNSLLTTNATDDNTEEEPQTNADLLPPDLKDAIFEDLPHELLDGISMLDIFPKFMNYEDLGNAADCKAEVFLNDQSKDGVSIATTATAAGTTPSSNMSDNDDTMNSAFSKQLELSNSWSSSSTTNSTNVNHVEDAMLGAARCQFKRSLSVDCYKAENLLRRVSGTSMSAATAALKRRKLSKSGGDNIALSLSQQHRLKKDTITAVALARRQSQCTDADYPGNQRAKAFTWSAAKRYMEAAATDNVADLHGIKLMQVDGVDDSITEYRIINADAQFNGTVKCERCHCTYRNYDSFQRHLANCEPLSTSESDSDRAISTSPADNVNATLLSADGISTELGKLARSATLSGGSNATANTTANLPFLQALQQATAAGIPIGGVQTTASIGGIPITNMQGVQGLQNLQGFQGLQNLQFQNYQPQTIGGGNFFISQAPTTSAANSVVVSSADDLQFFSNALQNLTANLNGTYTLAPTTTGYTVQQQATTAPQPQLIAVSTNPDGTQQIIQLPTTAAVHNPQYQIQAGSNGFATLQASSVCDKKFVLPIASKPLPTSKLNTKSGVPPSVATAAAKQKMKANANLKPMQVKIAPNAGTGAGGAQQQITVLNAGNGLSNGQLINQSLLQQLQAAANAQQQPLLFQAGSAGQATQQAPLIVQQPAQNIISFMTPDGAQYISIPTNDFKTQANPTTSYLTAAPNTTGGNSLLQGATFLQTDASGNLVLTTAPAAAPQTNGPLQMLSASPQVIGTLIQPQTLQLNGNVLTAAPTSDGQQPVIIGGTSSANGGTSGLEMIAATNSATPQVILATQPMYYGLETIVQNTVMSSQQFVSTAMPGVLSQNASFSATTTQVFQASKIEPLVDIPAGYVVLNNVEATPSTTAQQPSAHSFLNAASILQQQPATASDHQQTSNLETLYRLQQQSQASNSTATTTTTYQFATAQPMHQQQQTQIVTAKIQPVITQSKQRNTNTTANAKSASKVQPQVVNKVLPTSIAQQQNKASNFQKQQPKASVQQQQQSQQQANLFVRPATITALPANVATNIEPQTTQHIIVTQQQPTSKPTTAAIYETNQVITQQPQQHQIYTTTAQPLTATITIATPQTTTTTLSGGKASNPTTNMRKTNAIRPINKVEVKPKVLKTNLNATPSSAAFAKTTTTTNTTTIKLKPSENPSAPVTVTTTQQPVAQQYNFITNAQPKEKTEQSINIHQQQQQQQTTTILYDQQQQQIVEYQINEQTPQSNTIEAYKQSQQNEMLSVHLHAGNSSSNRLQFSSTNNIFNSNGNVPTNVVNPIQFATSMSSHSSMHSTTATTTTLTSRPTNRVLPMQQKQQQQDHSRANNNNSCNIISSNHANNSNKQNSQNVQQTTSASTTTTAKCFASPNANLKSCFETEIAKKVDEVVLEQYLQIQQPDNNQLHQAHHESIQVLHMQEQQQENGEITGAMSFTVAELKNGDLELQQTPSNQLEQAVNNLPNYDCSTGDNTDCLLDEKQRKKLIAAAYALNSDAKCAISENIINNVVSNGDDMVDDDDDGFSLKMPTDDDEGMDLDHEISDSDEPAVKAKICRILDNLTNDDCADSITTATTVEANAAIDNLQRIQFIDTDICESAANNNSNNLNGHIKLESPINDSGIATATYIDQITTRSEYVTGDAGDVFKKFKPDLTSPTQEPIKAVIEKTLKTEKSEEKPQLATTTPATDGPSVQQTAHHAQQQQPATHYTPRDPKKITGPHLLYEIQSEDGFTYKSSSITEVWEKVFEAVQVARRAHGLAPLPEGPLADMSGVQMIGLKTNALKYLIEQLPGVEKCSKYTPKYHKRSSPIASSSAASTSSSALSTASCEVGSCTSSLDYTSDQEDLHENPYDCARCEPYRYRSEYDMFSWLASRHRKQPIQVFVQPPDNELIARRGTGSNLPMAMKYRTLKETYKDYVGVFRSHIHGRGLYCTKDIEAGEMVIEYAGELIRATLTDKRERNYNSRGIGCYMFKIDDNLVVDATMRGNAARFINHSCEPNCYSKVVDILGHKHIIIFALRRIVQGEELTYDYKFPFEDEKIPCSCGSKKCRKYLN